MSNITRCPQCGTHFRITDVQRNVHPGLVRCGRCETVFNAVDNLYTPPQQLDLPLILDDIADVADLHDVYDPYADRDSQISLEAAARQVNDFSHIPDFYIAAKPKSASPRQKVLFAIGSVLLMFIIVMEAAYFFRVEIAARLPELKPSMLKICSRLNCSLPLPQKIDLISIESSELEADPTKASIITLHALLRSHAPYAMAYPNIELTLTNIQDATVARRTFSPAEYLPPETNAILGFPANQESTIKLHLNTTDLKPAGYRLFLFYPQ